MGLPEVVARLVGGELLILGALSALFLDFDRARVALRDPLSRLKEIAPHLGVLVVVLLVNRLFRHLGQELAWMLGWNITSLIYAIEDSLVVAIQSFSRPVFTVFFSFVYLYGYATLVVFPVVAYWILEDATPIRKTVLAYAANYLFGLVLYTLFISYGPRNLLPEAVDSLLYTAYPQTQLLTSSINANTNVFPSLHTSLSVTALLLARQTREQYRNWYRFTLPLTACVVVSTMYLGIHWATDVVAGVALAVVSVAVAERYHDFYQLQ